MDVKIRKRELPMMTDESAKVHRESLIKQGLITPSVQVYHEGERPYLEGGALLRLKAKYRRIGLIP